MTETATSHAADTPTGWCLDAIQGTRLVHLEDITVSLMGRRVLEHTDWTINRGENWLITGNNGSGKTTLLKALTGKLPLCTGWMKTNFTRPLSQAVARVAFDREAALITRENDEDFSRFFSGSESEGTSVNDYLEQAGFYGSILEPHVGTSLPTMARLRHRLLRNLSTGEMKMVMVAGALARCPDLLLLDEPFEGLDASSAGHLAALLSTLSGLGITLVVASHRMDVLPDLFSFRIHLDSLRVVSRETLTDLAGFPPMSLLPPSEPPQLKQLDPPSCTAPSEPLVRLNDVSIVYGTTSALSHLSWELKHGENWIIRGPNGSGKSTLASLIYADNPQAYANEVHVFGKQRGSGESIWEIKQRIGFVSNRLQINLQTGQTVLDTVVSGFFDSLGLFRRPSGNHVSKAMSILDQLGLSTWKRRCFNTLSTGEQRLVFIARALVKNPIILILDEINAGLDLSNRERILSLLNALGSPRHRAMIHITHHDDEIPDCMDFVLELPGNGIYPVTRQSHSSGSWRVCPALTATDGARSGRLPGEQGTQVSNKGAGVPVPAPSLR